MDDERIKALEERVKALEEQLAAKPPGVSCDFKIDLGRIKAWDASLQERVTRILRDPRARI